MNTQKHHVIPICMRGSDHETNIEKVTAKNHTLIHNILNIPHDYLRNFRRRTNERTIRNGERSKTYHKLRKLYFQNLDELPEDLLLIHNRSFSKQISRGYKQIHSLMKGIKVEDTYERDMALIDYHDTQGLKYGELVENIERKLFNLMRVDRDRNELFISYYNQKLPILDINHKQKSGEEKNKNQKPEHS